MQKYYFCQCTLTRLDDTFGLRQVFSNATLEHWLAIELALSTYEKDALQHLRQLLTINAPGWNEQELALHFIGPLLSVVQFTEPYRFNLFAERQISAIISGLESEIELSGSPDGMIATGYREPRIPLFAFTEDKRQIDPEGDPAGQTLAAMLVAQALNGDHAPIYGAYVIGSDWRFMILEGKQYTISRDYSALSDEIFDILRILKALKGIILERTAT